MALNQSNRLIRMTSGPLGPDEVVVTRFSGREAISRPFDFELEFISTRLDLKPAEIIGTQVGLELDRRDQQAEPIEPRHFNGYVNRFSAGQVVVKNPGQHKYRYYRAGLVPWLWFLTRTARCFLFFPEREDKTIYDVIEAVLDRAKADLHVDPVSDLQGIGDLRNRKVKHCVQYRETDFNFVSRTMEKYGAFYYFRFEKGKHTLVLDMKANYPACVEANVAFPRLGGGQPVADHVTDWQHDFEFVSGKWSHTDYNFETPSTSLLTSAPRLPSVDVPSADKYEVYDYPGGHAVKAESNSDARIRQEAQEVAHNVVEGASTCRTFTAGHKFTLSTHPDEDVVSEQGKGYLLTSVEHSAQQPTDDTTDATRAGYANRFTCVADSVQFRPARVTPTPVISGAQTAVVVGPAGTEIYTDKYGRVKVQFHWDRVGKKDGNTSCWVRVSSPWAGKGWGAVNTPRVGQEVIVEFLEGDPDQPIITGRVYNAEQAIPFGFPAGAVISGVKSDTHKGSGYNELSMDDTAGKEKITIHGQYDMNTTIEHDQTSTIHNNRTDRVDVNDSESVGNNQSLTVSVNRTKNVGADETITIGANRTSTVKASETATVMLQRTHTVGVNETISVGGAQEVTVGGLQAITVGALQAISVGASQSTNVGGSQSTNVSGSQSTDVGGSQSTGIGKSRSVSVGGDESHSVKGARSANVGKDDALKVANNLVIDAGDAVTIKTGSASITMKKDGTIVLKGKDISIQGSGSIAAKASSDVVIKGSKVGIN